MGNFESRLKLDVLSCVQTTTSIDFGDSHGEQQRERERNMASWPENYISLLDPSFTSSDLKRSSPGPK